jgi:hypothetical protein
MSSRHHPQMQRRSSWHICKGGVAMDAFHIMIVLLISGFLLLGIGFNNREQEWGIWLTGLGALSMFAPLFFKVFIEFG